MTVHHGDGPVHDVGQACTLTLQDGRQVAERLPRMLPNRWTDDLATRVDAVLPADVDGPRRMFDLDGLAEGRTAPPWVSCRLPEVREPWRPRSHGPGGCTRRS